MKEVILIKDGELALKGLNRSVFEDKMISTIKRRLKKYGPVTISKAQSTVCIEPIDDSFNFPAALDDVGRVFGIAAYSRAGVCEKDMSAILREMPGYLKDILKDKKTFKVEAKRADKSFPFTSPQISANLGGEILKNYPYLMVDVHSPETIITVEIREKGAYVRGAQYKGAGGLPTGTSGKAAVLISGGIDSPVASYLMAKRGVSLLAIHFASPPYTSIRAEEKVKTLISKVARYCGTIKLAVVPFTEIQEEIGKHCPEDYFTLIMRRLMMRISSRVAADNGCLALITGESLGQVASQTLPALSATDEVSTLPVLRPLIGMDKEEIVVISKKIDAFETSILPYEDCCTVFTPKHPHTKPKKGQCEMAEKDLDIEPLIERAISGIEYSFIE
ncbi:MAG: tRNA 4-thiouridine(8) synthase ThiI [Clostridia bacterium]|nr:tRNA 4-thiouridine(8) synthase ThiI [Clostridia bacterium]